MRGLILRTEMGEELRTSPAPAAARAQAFFLDHANRWARGALLVLLAGSFLGPSAPAGSPEALLLGLVLTWLLLVGPAWTQHRDRVTEGQRRADLRLIRMNGDPPSLADCLVRELLRPLDCLTPLVLLTVVGARRSLGERAAGLALVRPRPPEEAR